jgi:protein TonB
MLAYAANRPVPGKRQSSPNALLFVISVHVALLAVVMSAKMDLPARLHPGPRLIRIPIAPPPPPPAGSTVKPRPQQHMTTVVDKPDPTVPLPPIGDQPVATGGDQTGVGPIAGGGTAVTPVIPKPMITPIHHDPRLLTPPSELKPPYPPSKILSEEEAVLRLRLAIDEHGRVVAVDPVGAADRAFVDAARRHLIARWRYQPATEDGRAVASSMVITLRFQLDG